MPARGEFVNQVRADEAGRARDKTFHDVHGKPLQLCLAQPAQSIP